MSIETNTPEPAKKSHKVRNITLWVVGTFVALAVIGSFIPDEETAPADAKSSQSSEKPKSEKPKADKKADKPKPEPKTTPRDDLADEIDDIDGDAGVEFSPGQVTVTFEIDENLSDGMTNTGAQVHTRDFLQAVAESDVSADVVHVIGTFPMQDEYGNVDESSEVVSVVYTSDVLDKINFSNIQSEDVWDLADLESFVHPEFQD